MEREYFSSRWGFVFAALGMAIGTGNVWRFPRIAAKNGGGAFIIAWIITLFLWSIPILIIEFGMGKSTRKGVIGAFGKIGGEKYLWMGSFVVFCTMSIMYYYAVVTGWCVKYYMAADAVSENAGRHVIYGIVFHWTYVCSAFVFDCDGGDGGQDVHGFWFFSSPVLSLT